MQHCLESWDVIYPSASLKRIAADGNCQFRALSWALYGTEDRHRDVRVSVCDYMHRNIARYVQYMVDAAAYVSGMRRQGTYGDRVSLQAFCDAYRSNVMVVSENAVSLVNARRKSPASYLVVTYHNGCHYNAVTPYHASPTPHFLRQLRPTLNIENSATLPLSQTRHGR